MKVPLILRIGALVLATTGFYTYVGQMVPQKEVQAPQEVALKGDLTTDEMVKVGREIMEGKGLCLTCHTIGKTGALRFPDLAGVDGRAKTRVAGMNDVEYLAQSMYEPTAFVVPGFPPAMPPINKPPIGLTDQEILCVIAALQALGGTPTVTLQTKHHYNSGAAAPGGAAPAPPAPPKGAQLRPAVTSPSVMTVASAEDPGVLRRSAAAVANIQPMVAHHQAAARPDAAVHLADQPPLKLRRSAEASAKAEARQGAGGVAR
jgi:hypothetical protein